MRSLRGSVSNSRSHVPHVEHRVRVSWVGSAASAHAKRHIQTTCNVLREGTVDANGGQTAAVDHSVGKAAATVDYSVGTAYDSDGSTYNNDYVSSVDYDYGSSVDSG